MRDQWSVAGFIGVYVAMRIVDAILPDGHHWRRMDRFLNRDNNKETPNEP